MSARLNRSLQLALDVAILSFAYWLAFLFRFELNLKSTWVRVLVTTWPYVIVLQYAGLVAFGVYSIMCARWMRIGSDVTRSEPSPV